MCFFELLPPVQQLFAAAAHSVWTVVCRRLRGSSTDWLRAWRRHVRRPRWQTKSGESLLRLPREKSTAESQVLAVEWLTLPARTRVSDRRPEPRICTP